MKLFYGANMQFFIDRGGTFTDIVAIINGRILYTNSCLKNPEAYDDAAIQGIRDILEIPVNQPLPTMLYSHAVEISARYNAQGQELRAVNLEQVRQDLQIAFDEGIRSCAIVLSLVMLSINTTKQFAVVRGRVPAWLRGKRRRGSSRSPRPRSPPCRCGRSPGPCPSG